MTDLLSRLTDARPSDADLDADWSTDERAITGVALAHRVEADSRGIVIRRPPCRSIVVPWDDIAELRVDVPPPWGTKLVIVTKSDEVIDLLLEPSEHGPVEAWRSRLESRGA